jgi:hypothetical protein
MRMPSPIVAGSIAIGVFAGGFAIGHFVTDDSGSSTSAKGKPQVLGQVFAENPDTSTSTTVATLAPVTPGTQPATTSAPANTLQPSAGTQTSTATAAPAATQTTSPPATTTVVVSNPDCGSGTATASVASQTFPKSNTASPDWETDATASVHNGVDKAIQIDSLTIRLFYGDGSSQDVVFNNAVGNVLQPGVTNNYSVAINTGKRPVQTTTMQSFSFHTAGHPECAGRSA